MKKMILTSASILALSMAAPAIAQSLPVADPQAAPAECTSVSGNCSTIDQEGTGGVASVTQSGSGNVSDINQVEGSRATEATVTQTGTNALSFVEQAGGLNNDNAPTSNNIVEVTQSGDGSQSTIFQGPANTLRAEVIQDGDSTSFIQQTGNQGNVEVRQQGGDGNDSVVYQDGSRNQVSAQNPAAAFDTNVSGVNQTGNDNTSLIYQGDFASDPVDGSERARANVTQTGDDNQSLVVQTVSNPNSFVDIIQRNGNRNISDAFQSGRGGDIEVTQQNGDDNYSFVDQTSQAGTGTASIGAVSAKLTQNGDQNDSFITQDADNATLIVTQTSTGPVFGAPRDDQPDYLGEDAEVRANYSRAVQDGAGTFDATVTQFGTGNRSDIAQTADSGTSIADVMQTGTFNNSAIEQTQSATAKVTQGGAYGDNNSRVVQNAVGADATVSQFGNDTTNGPNFPSNESFIFQNDAAVANVMQTGSQNLSTITQGMGANGALAVVTQETRPAAIGNSDLKNESTVTQFANTSAFVEQIGQNNDSKVTQNVGASNDAPNNGLTYAVEVQQLGEDGISEVTQNGANNEARLVQAAGTIGNESYITQNGTDSFADVLQSGSDNYSTITQGGSGHTASVTQSSDSNVSTITQSGMGNSAIVTQGGM